MMGSAASFPMFWSMSGEPAGVFSELSCCHERMASLVRDQLRLAYLTDAVTTSAVLVGKSCAAIGEPFRPKHRTYFRLADFPKAYLCRRWNIHRCVGVTFVALYHDPTAWGLLRQRLAWTAWEINWSWCQAVFSRRSHAPPSLARQQPYRLTWRGASFILNASPEWGGWHGVRMAKMAPPGVSYPGHFAAIPYGTTLAA